MTTVVLERCELSLALDFVPTENEAKAVNPWIAQLQNDGFYPDSSAGLDSDTIAQAREQADRLATELNRISPVTFSGRRVIRPGSIYDLVEYPFARVGYDVSGKPTVETYAVGGLALKTVRNSATQTSGMIRYGDKS